MMIAIDLAGILMVITYMIVRLGVPILLMCLLCTILPRLLPAPTR